jgi:hypothetical protein
MYVARSHLASASTTGPRTQITEALELQDRPAA